MRIGIVGAGIIGCALAFRLSQAGHDVVVVEAGRSAGGGASGASFGWINASFFLDPDHFELRKAGLDAWRRLSDEVGLPMLRWQGALWWEEQGAALEAMARSLTGLGYDVARLNAEDVAARAPALRTPPAQALHFAQEGIAEPSETARCLLDYALANGSRAVFGARVLGQSQEGLHTDQGDIRLDRVIVTAGTGSAALIAAAGGRLPLKSSPGVLLRTEPVPLRLSHVLVTPEGEIRQDSAHRLVMPAAIAHQKDHDNPGTGLIVQADAAMDRLKSVIALPSGVSWTDVHVAERPVPEDGLPVIGPVSDTLYVAVMHSGVTLAAVVADLVAAEITGTVSNHLPKLERYRPQRFGAV